MAAAPPAIAAVPHATFGAFYTDASLDEHSRNYALLMGCFAIPGLAPAVLRDLATNNPLTSSVGYIHLSLMDNNPAGPGILRVVHNTVRFRTVLGQPATQWDNRIFGSIGDAVGNQIPPTVEMPINSLSLRQ